MNQSYLGWVINAENIDVGTGAKCRHFWAGGTNINTPTLKVSTLSSSFDISTSCQKSCRHQYFRHRLTTLVHDISRLRMMTTIDIRRLGLGLDLLLKWIIVSKTRRMSWASLKTEVKKRRMRMTSTNRMKEISLTYDPLFFFIMKGREFVSTEIMNHL